MSLTVIFLTLDLMYCANDFLPLRRPGDLEFGITISRKYEALLLMLDNYKIMYPNYLTTLSSTVCCYLNTVSRDLEWCFHVMLTTVSPPC